MQLEDTWSRNDRDPVIHEFSANAGLQADFDKECHDFGLFEVVYDRRFL